MLLLLRLLLLLLDHTAIVLCVLGARTSLPRLLVRPHHPIDLRLLHVTLHATTLRHALHVAAAHVPLLLHARHVLLLRGRRGVEVYRALWWLPRPLALAAVLGEPNQDCRVALVLHERAVAARPLVAAAAVVGDGEALLGQARLLQHRQEAHAGFARLLLLAPALLPPALSPAAAPGPPGPGGRHENVVPEVVQPIPDEEHGVEAAGVFVFILLLLGYVCLRRLVPRGPSRHNDVF
mmetsp:Transcript_121094/g.386734  ORF Transcript_121094/g.386734 Transcript_121094/m.386734 type:complete len:236 (-) Transcript_121094:435-1142(-)